MTPTPVWSALPKALTICAIASACAAAINFATSDSASPLWWIAVVVLTIAAALVPILSRQHLAALAKRRFLIPFVLTLILVGTAGDTQHLHLQPKPQESVASATSTSTATTSAAATPSTATIPIRPRPLDFDSETAAARLTGALRAANLLPKDIRVNPSTYAHEPPLTFTPSQGEFKAIAILEDHAGRALLLISVSWYDGLGPADPCPPIEILGPETTCETTTWPDGTRLTQTVHAGADDTQVILVAMRPDNTAVAVHLANNDENAPSTRNGLPLSLQQLAAIATSQALTLT